MHIVPKYRCMTCEGTPTIGDAAAAEAHLTANIGHELTQRLTSVFVPDEPEGDD